MKTIKRFLLLYTSPYMILELLACYVVLFTIGNVFTVLTGFVVALIVTIFLTPFTREANREYQREKEIAKMIIQ